METSAVYNAVALMACRSYMPLLTELGGLGDGLFYKYDAPTGAFAFQPHLFNRAKPPLKCHSERSEESLITSKRWNSQRCFAPLNMTTPFMR